MKLNYLEIANFRCHDLLKIEFNNLNVLIYGNNGIGKTSLLEAIHIGLSSKSFKTTSIQKVIAKDKMFSKIILKINDDIFIKHLVTTDKRSIMINEKLIAKTSQFIEKYPVVCFSQRDYNFFFTTPSFRRDYFDFEIVKLHAGYQKTLHEYQKILKHRNALLKKMKFDDDPVFLNIINDTLYAFACEIIEKRIWFCNRLNELLHEISLYHKFKYHFLVEYVINAREQQLKKHLYQSYQKDIILQSTSAGPHRDDYKITYKSQDVSEIFSAGEQKLAIYILKLAIMSLFREEKQIDPIFLIDDVFAELDQTNTKKIINNLPLNTQNIITTTINYHFDKFQIINLNIKEESKEMK